MVKPKNIYFIIFNAISEYSYARRTQGIGSLACHFRRPDKNPKRIINYYLRSIFNIKKNAKKSPALRRGYFWWVLQEAVGVVEDQTGLVLRRDVGIAAVGTVTQRRAEAFKRACLDHVIHTQVAFPLGLVFTHAVGSLDVIATQVGGRGFQARNTQRSEVVGVLTESGVLTSTDEAVNHGVGEQVEARSSRAFVATVAVDHVALVQVNEATVIADTLMAEQEGVGTQGVGEHGAPGLVIDLARVLGETTVVIEPIARIAVLAVGAAVEIAQVCLERLVGCDRVDVHQTEEALLVVVFQVRVVVLQGEVFGDLPVRTGIPELVAFFGTACHGQAGGVRRGATRCVLKLADVKGEVVDFLRGDGATFKALWQQTTVVRDQNRHVRLQSAAQVSLGLRETRLDVGGCATPWVRRRTVGIAWEEGVVIRVVTTATVQMNANDRLGIDTESNNTLSETRLVIELETFSGLSLIVRSPFAGVRVVIHGAGTDGCLAVFDKTRGACLLRQNPYGHGQGQGGLVHCFSSSRF